MQSGTEDELDRIFQALSDSTRRELLRQIGSSTRSVSELAAPHALSFAAISKHLKVLEVADLIERRKDGSFQMISLNAETLKAANDWLDYYRQFWTGRLDDLDFILTGKKDSANDQA